MAVSVYFTNNFFQCLNVGDPVRVTICSEASGTDIGREVFYQAILSNPLSGDFLTILFLNSTQVTPPFPVPIEVIDGVATFPTNPPFPVSSLPLIPLACANFSLTFSRIGQYTITTQVVDAATLEVLATSFPATFIVGPLVSC